jgi:hypothetical protein
MAASILAIWIILLAGAISLCGLFAHARAVRLDPPATMLAGGLVSLACVAAASVYLSPDW